MSEARAQGLSFDEAWDLALRPNQSIVMVTAKDPPAGAIRWPTDRTDRLSWQAAIAATREGWRRSFEGEPLTLAERGLEFLADGFRALDIVASARAAQEGIEAAPALQSVA